MSINQSRADKSEAHLRKSGRSGNYSQSRNFTGGDVKGGASAPAPPPSASVSSSTSSTVNRSIKKFSNGQGGQSIPNVSSLATQNGIHAFTSSRETPDVSASHSFNPVAPSIKRVPQTFPKVPPPSQSGSGATGSLIPNTSSKVEASSTILQFGSITPSFVNIPARTNSAPPNLDEQKNDQVRHSSFRATPTLPIPSRSNPPQSGKTGVNISQSMTRDSRAVIETKKESRPHIPAIPITTSQKSSINPVNSPSMPISFQSPQALVQPQQNIVSSTLPLPMGNAPQVSQMFVTNIPAHLMQPQSSIHHGQNLSFPPQMSHQINPQLTNLGLMGTQFGQQPTGKTSASPIKITDPKTGEEFRYGEMVNSSGMRANHSLPPQSQSFPSFPSPPTSYYYPSMQPISYNPSQNLFPSSSQFSMTGNQMGPAIQVPRHSYSVSQGMQTIPFMNPPVLNSMPISNVSHSIHANPDSANIEDTHSGHHMQFSGTSSSIPVTVKPPPASIHPKMKVSSVTIAPPVSHGETAKASIKTVESSSSNQKEDIKMSSESYATVIKNISLPTGSLVSSETKSLASLNVDDLSQKYSTPAAGHSVSEESIASIANTDGGKKVPIKKSGFFQDQSYKGNKKDITHKEHQLLHDALQLPVSILELTGDTPSLDRTTSCEIKASEKGEKSGNPVTLEASGVPIEPVPLQTAFESEKKDKTDNTSGVLVDDMMNGSLVDASLADNTLIQDHSFLGNVELDKETEKANVQMEFQMDSFFTASISSMKETEPVSESKDKIINAGNTNLAKGLSIESNRETDITNGIKEELVISEATSSSYNHSETNASLSNFHSKISEADSVIGKTNNQEVCMTESKAAHQETIQESRPRSSDMALRRELKGVGGTSSGQMLKDKPVSDPNKAKNMTVKKIKLKEILLKADAAGTSSDLYMAYKGPEENPETSATIESNDRYSSVDAVPNSTRDIEKELAANEENIQSKSEPDDWEDAAEISTPNIETSEKGQQVHEMMKQGNGDETEFTCKKYSRDFLLTFSEHCTEIPVNFVIGSDVTEALMCLPVATYRIIDHESHSAYARIVDRSSVGPRLDRHGSNLSDDDRWNKMNGPYGIGRDPRGDMMNDGFRPGQQGSNYGAARNLRGASGGILSSPASTLIPQGVIPRNNVDSGRWQRAVANIHNPVPQSPLQTMHKAEKKYEVGKVSDAEEHKQRQLKAILNKLTPQNFEKLFEQVKDVNIDNTITLKGVISQIFDKALTEPTFCEMYANFCVHLANELPDFSENNEKTTFRRLLLNKCQEEFEKGEREQAEANMIDEEGEDKLSKSEIEEKRNKARHRMLGNIRLIGELYKKKMLTERIMHECIKKLLGQLQNPDEEDIEALCKLMSTIGEIIDHPKAKEHIDAYFEGMSTLSNNLKLSSRVRFMLKDAIDLRRNKWQQRRKVEGPKKIDEVHKDAAEERQAQSNRAPRGSVVTSSYRKGQPMDYLSKGNNLMPSSNSQQTRGFRSIPSQSRGYGTQDIRFEDRHPLNSRVPSVPLPQRLVAEESLTLGPQGGLGRGMSIKGQTPISSAAPSHDGFLGTGDHRRLPYNTSVSDSTSYSSRETRYIPERSIGPSHDQLYPQEHSRSLGSREPRNDNHPFDRINPNESGAVSIQETSSESQDTLDLQNKSIAAIAEYYSARSKTELVDCVKELNAPSFYPQMLSLWIVDSFERKDVERGLLADLIIYLSKSRDSLLSQMHMVKGFKSVFDSLEDAITDSPRAVEYLARILAKLIMEKTLALRDITKLIQEGGEEPGCLIRGGIASEVLGTIFELIRSEKGESVLNEIRASSNFRLEDFRNPNQKKPNKLDAFI